MKIIDIRETTVSLASVTGNANINFNQMTVSAVVVTTDYRRNNKPLCGLGFDSIGHYGHGSLLRERFVPRLLAADESLYQDALRDSIDPDKVWRILMQNEKPVGEHGKV